MAGEQVRKESNKVTEAGKRALVPGYAAVDTARLSTNGQPVFGSPAAAATGNGEPALASLLASAEALRLANQFSQAEGLYRQVLDRDPRHASAWSGLGQMASASRNFDLGASLFGKAIACAPSEPAHYVDLGICLGAMNRVDLAIQAQRKALQLAPEFLPALNNLGKALCARNQVNESIACLRQALRLAPNLGAAHWNLALSLLVAGRLREGWEEFEWRLQVNPALDAKPGVPKWQGEPAPGQTVLLCAEQGLGDAIQFLRYAPRVKARVGRLIVSCPASLVNLFKATDGVDEVVPDSGPTPRSDKYAMLLSLPRIFGTELATIPASIPYLKAPPNSWGPPPPPNDLALRRIGLVWAGNPRHPDDTTRSAPLASLAPLLTLPGHEFFSLQVGPRSADLSQLKAAASITDWAPRLRDYSDTAAALGTLDLLITVDTSVAHLAGALGYPVWVLLAFNPDWRWLLERGDTPWYPSMRLFRQPAPGDWPGLLQAVAAELLKLVLPRQATGPAWLAAKH